jgi:hypothetical protein
MPYLLYVRVLSWEDRYDFQIWSFLGLHRWSPMREMNSRKVCRDKIQNGQKLGHEGISEEVVGLLAIIKNTEKYFKGWYF